MSHFAPSSSHAHSDACACHALSLTALFDEQTLDIAFVELEAAREHLRTCNACRLQWREWEQTRDLLTRTTPLPPPGLALWVKIALRRQLRFESVPTPPPGLRDAILRATVGKQMDDAVPEINASPEATASLLITDSLKATSSIESFDAPSETRHIEDMQWKRPQRMRSRMAAAWLTPALAAWLLFLSRNTLAPLPPTVTFAPVTAPTVRQDGIKPEGIKTTDATPWHFSTSREKPTPGTGGALSPSTGGTPHTITVEPHRNPGVAPILGAGHTASNTVEEGQGSERRGALEVGESHHSTVSAGQHSDGSEVSSERHAANPRAASEPRVQLANWTPSHAESADDAASAAPASDERPHTHLVRPMSAPALSAAPERAFVPRAAPQQTVSGREDAMRSVVTRTSLGVTGREQAVRGHRPALITNVVTTPRSMPTVRRGATRFAPTRVAMPQLISRVSWNGDASDAGYDGSEDDSDSVNGVLIADRRPAEVSRVVDDFRAALDDDGQ